MSERQPAGRTVPHDLAAEASLLGAMLLSTDAVATAVDLVGSDDFHHPGHANVYDAIVTMWAAGQPIDPVTVADELRRCGQLDTLTTNSGDGHQASGPAALVHLQAGATPSAAAGYARIVEETSTLRRLIGAASTITETGYSHPADVAAALDQAEQAIYLLADQRRRAGNTQIGLYDALLGFLDDLEARWEGRGVTGIPTGLTNLDRLLGGLRPGQLVVIAARPAMGKTATAIQIAMNTAVEQHPTLFVSVEMALEELRDRLVASAAHVHLDAIRSGRMADSDSVRITHAMGRLGNATLDIDDQPETTLLTIRAAARRAAKKYGQLGLIVVDYLQLMNGRAGAENRQVEIAEISRGLKVLARELHVPVLALSQLNRAVENRADKRPMLADLRESGAIENDADVVIGLYRDEYYKPDSPDRGVLEAIILKQRQGPTGVAKLVFDPRTQRIVDLAPPSRGAA